MAATVERYYNRPDWLYGRKDGLGASDAPRVLGFHPERGAYTLATDKLTQAIDDSPQDETAEWGLRHEPAIAQKFAEVMGWEIEP